MRAEKFSIDLPIAVLACVAIAVYLPVRSPVPLWIALGAGGGPLLIELIVKMWRRNFGADLLAGIAIVAAIWQGEYLAGTIVVLMLSGGAALENYAVRSASSVLRALSQRMPSVAHRKKSHQVQDVALEAIGVGDELVIFPHEICPVDGVVLEGRGVMDESFLTGEPFHMSKTPGVAVISGAVNGEVAITIRALKRAEDSRYAKIMAVMHESEQRRPRIRRLGDQLGAWYTPLAVAVAATAWLLSGSATRFLAVLVVATPCPLLIAIPVALIGSISLAARRGIIVRDPAALEQIDQCRSVIFDKTGTLTHGEPQLTEQLCVEPFIAHDVLWLAASLEQYSKHPLARAVLAAAQAERLVLPAAMEISERPGEGLRGMVAGRSVQITSRGNCPAAVRLLAPEIPPNASGLECVVLIDAAYAATYRFHDAPRADGHSFISHLGPKHQLHHAMIVSGDRESEVRHLAAQVGITNIHAEKSPEEKLHIVREHTTAHKTLYIGDGINDAPALMAATVGIAIGQHSDITTEAAGVVIMDSSLARVDEFMHISRRMRRIALQSAIGGMLLSLIGMAFAAAGLLSPVVGAIAQEVIDILAVANALRAAVPPRVLTDY